MPTVFHMPACLRLPAWPPCVGAPPLFRVCPPTPVPSLCCARTLLRAALFALPLSAHVYQDHPCLCSNTALPAEAYPLALNTCKVSFSHVPTEGLDSRAGHGGGGSEAGPHQSRVRAARQGKGEVGGKRVEQRTKEPGRKIKCVQVSWRCCATSTLATTDGEGATAQPWRRAACRTSSSASICRRKTQQGAGRAFHISLPAAYAFGSRRVVASTLKQPSKAPHQRLALAHLVSQRLLLPHALHVFRGEAPPPRRHAAPLERLLLCRGGAGQGWDGGHCERARAVEQRMHVEQQRRQAARRRAAQHGAPGARLFLVAKGWLSGSSSWSRSRGAMSLQGRGTGKTARQHAQRQQAVGSAAGGMGRAGSLQLTLTFRPLAAAAAAPPRSARPTAPQTSWPSCP